MDIQLVKWTADNQQDMIRVINCVDRKYLSERLPKPYTQRDADWWYENMVSLDGEKGIFRGISVDGHIAGSISVEPKQDVFRRDCELGYLLDTEQWSKGVMTEAVRQICVLAFAQLDIARITAYICSANIASRRVVEKNGFRLEGVMRQAVYKDGCLYDLFIYGKLRETEENT